VKVLEVDFCHLPPRPLGLKFVPNAQPRPERDPRSPLHYSGQRHADVHLYRPPPRWKTVEADRSGLEYAVDLAEREIVVLHVFHDLIRYDKIKGRIRERKTVRRPDQAKPIGRPLEDDVAAERPVSRRPPRFDIGAASAPKIENRCVRRKRSAHVSSNSGEEAD
jgi:hypothetical protein